MTLTSETFGSVVVIHSPEELVQESAAALIEAVNLHLEQGRKRIVLQLEHTDTVDSLGLESLLDAQDAARKAGGALCLSGLTDSFRSVFAMTRLDRRFEQFDSVIDAVTRLKNG